MAPLPSFLIHVSSRIDPAELLSLTEVRVRSSRSLFRRGETRKRLEVVTSIIVQPNGDVIGDGGRVEFAEYLKENRSSGEVLLLTCEKLPVGGQGVVKVKV